MFGLASLNRPSRPARIVTNGQAGAALASLGVRPVGIFSGGPTDQNPVLGGIDLTGIESVGEVYSEINVEKFAALAPDLVVVPYDPRQDGPPFGFVDGPVQGQVETIVPILAIDGIKETADVIRRFAELAAALGADLQAPAPAAARTRFEDAGSALRAAVEAKPGLLAVALYASPAEGISFCRPATFPGLRQLQQLGLELVVPGGGAADINEDFTNFFFDSVSLELADKYPADLILLDADTSPEDMAGVPTWAALPAVQAGQIVAFRRLGTPSEPSTSSGDSAFPVTIEHKFGSTTIAAPPKRVVTVGDEDIAVALGVTPVGIVRNTSYDSGVAPWLEDRIDLAKTTLIDVPAGAEGEGAAGVNIEQVAALKPDLILAVNDFGLEIDYPKLSQIAPTVGYETAWVSRAGRNRP